MIIGVTGTNGAGKGTVVEYLVKEKGFTHYSAREFLTKEIERRGLPMDRDSLRIVGDSLRAEHGPEYVIASLYSEAAQQSHNAVLESVRAIGEVHFLHDHGALLFAVDADRKIRYERSTGRGSYTDKVDFDTWVAQEEREWHNAAAHKMDVPGVIKVADYTFQNNGSLEELHAQIDQALAKIEA